MRDTRNKWREMAAYALGWIGFSVFWPFNMTRVPLYLSDALSRAGVTDQRILGLLLGMLGVFGMIVPVAIGSLSDRLATPLGRRRPVMLAALPIFAAGLIGLLAWPKLWQKAVSLAAMYLGAYCMQTPYQALMPEIVPTGRRGTVNGLVNLITMAGTIAYLGLGTLLWRVGSIGPSGAPSEPGSGTSGSIGPFLTVGMILALFVIGLASLVMGVSERMPERTEGRLHPVSAGSFFDALRSTPDFIRYLVAAFLMWLGFNMVSPYFTLYATRELHLSEQTAFLVLAGMALGAALGAVPAGIVGDRFGRRRAIIISILVLSVCLSYGYFVTRVEQGIIMMAVGGVGFAFISVLPYALALDLMPPERIGQFIGVNNMCTALSNLIGPVLGGFIAESPLGYRGIFPLSGVLLLGSVAIFRTIRERPIRMRMQGS